MKLIHQSGNFSRISRRESLPAIGSLPPAATHVVCFHTAIIAGLRLAFFSGRFPHFIQWHMACTDESMSVSLCMCMQAVGEVIKLDELCNGQFGMNDPASPEAMRCEN